AVGGDDRRVQVARLGVGGDGQPAPGLRRVVGAGRPRPGDRAPGNDEAGRGGAAQEVATGMVQESSHRSLPQGHSKDRSGWVGRPARVKQDLLRRRPRKFYSTVTLLAKLRGWSTSQPLTTATW